MKIFRSALAAALLMSAVMAPALAQAPSINYTAPAQFGTYRAEITGLVPAAATTDFFTIAGASGKQVQIRTIHCDGYSTTAAGGAVFQVVKRNTLNTSGTSTTITGVRLNSTNSVASATVKAYTVNPTLGVSIGAVAEGVMSNSVASPAFNNPGMTFDFTDQKLMINESTTVVAVNGLGVTPYGAPTYNCWIEWSEQ